MTVSRAQFWKLGWKGLWISLRLLLSNFKAAEQLSGPAVSTLFFQGKHQMRTVYSSPVAFPKYKRQQILERVPEIGLSQSVETPAALSAGKGVCNGA
jgi:hypothetical protein